MKYEESKRGDNLIPWGTFSSVFPSNWSLDMVRIVFQYIYALPSPPPNSIDRLPKAVIKLIASFVEKSAVTPLLAQSIEAKEFGVTRFSLQMGADPNVHFGNLMFTTVLDHSIRSQDKRMVRLLLDYKASMHRCTSLNSDVYGVTRHYDSQTVGRINEWLIRLILDIRLGVIENVRLNLTIKVFNQLPDLFLKLVTDIIPKYGQTGMVKFLLNHSEIKIDQSVRDHALRTGAKYGRDDMVRLLVESKAAINPGRTYSGESVDLAIENGHETVARYLFEKGAEMSFRAPMERGLAPVLIANGSKIPTFTSEEKRAYLSFFGEAKRFNEEYPDANIGLGLMLNKIDNLDRATIQKINALPDLKEQTRLGNRFELQALSLLSKSALSSEDKQRCYAHLKMSCATPRYLLTKGHKLFKEPVKDYPQPQHDLVMMP